MSQRKRKRELCRHCHETPAQTGDFFAGCCSLCARHIRSHGLCVRCSKTKAQRNAKFLGLCYRCYGECAYEAECRKCGVKQSLLQSRIAVWRSQNTDGLCEACFQALRTCNTCFTCYTSKRAPGRHPRCHSCKSRIARGHFKNQVCRRCKAMLSAEYAGSPNCSAGRVLEH